MNLMNLMNPRISCFKEIESPHILKPDKKYNYNDKIGIYLYPITCQ